LRRFLVLMIQML